MIDRIKDLLIKYREIIAYLIVGAITTFAGWGAKWLGTLFLDSSVVWQNTLLSVINWAAGVAVAYPLNRKYVFESKSPEILKEFIEFVAGRLATGGLDILLNLLMVNVFGWPLWLSTFFSAVVVVISNYVVSKLWVFKNNS